MIVMSRQFIIFISKYVVSNRCHTTSAVRRFGPAPLRSRVIHYLQGRSYPWKHADLHYCSYPLEYVDQKKRHFDI